MHLCVFSASYLNATTQAGKKREHRRKSAPAICPARCMIEMERTSNGAARHALLVKFNSTKVQTLTPAPPAHAQHTGVYATPKNKTVSGVQRGLSQVCLSCAPSPRRHASAILRLLCALRPTGRGPRTRIWPTEMP